MITQERPRKLSASELSQMLELHALPGLVTKLQSLPFDLGAEYSHYLRSGFKAGIDPLDILSDKDRIVGSTTWEKFDDVDVGAIVPLPRRVPHLSRLLSPIPFWDVRAFMGRTNSPTCLHVDWNIGTNLLLNLEGKKHFHFYSPESSANFPGVALIAGKHTEAPEEVIYLSEGEALLIPPLWWHQAFYETRALSLSFRFHTDLPAHTTLMKKYYPSWKLLLLMAKGIELPTGSYAEIERELHQILGLPPRSDQDYDSFNLAYLKKYLGRSE